MVSALGTSLHAVAECLTAAGVVGAWTHDIRTNRVVADDDVARLFGIYDPDDVNGDAFARYAQAIHPGDRTGFEAEVAAASCRGLPIALQYRIRTSAGVHFVHDYGSFTLDAAGKPCRGQGIVIDTTRARLKAGDTSMSMPRIEASEAVQRQLNDLAKHALAASKVARAVHSAPLRDMTDTLLLEVGRLLAWILAKREC